MSALATGRGPSTFSIVNLGCKVNRVESDAFASLLESLGASASPMAEAELVIVNTCTVTGEAEKKTRKALHRVVRENASGEILVTGCAAAIDPETLRSFDPRVEIVAKDQVETRIVRLFGSKATLEAAVLARLPHEASVSGALPYEVETAEGGALETPAPIRAGKGYPTRVGIKVQDGCDNACSYCIVHTARGRARSMDRARILGEARKLADAGVKEMVLTGINLGSYRDDLGGLAPLLEELLEMTAQHEMPPRFRISSIEPTDLDEATIDLLASSDGRICRHLHLPLQAGSSRVLEEMGRPYRAEEFRALVTRLYERVPALSLSTDIIVGFPGEREEDFAETLALARDCRFSRIHVFPFSRREGTPAAARDDQIPASVKARRAAELRELGKGLLEEDFARRKGTVELCLVEATGRATTESYHRIEVAPELPVGALLPLPLLAPCYNDAYDNE